MRESERRRYADPTFVDKVIELDATWREGASLHGALKPKMRCCAAVVRFRAQFPAGVVATRAARVTACAHAALGARAVRFKLDHINREYNATNKEVAKKKMARPRPALGASAARCLTELCARALQAKEDASAEIAACEEIDKRRLLLEVRCVQRRLAGPALEQNR